jgi:hypothetical protein
LLIRLYIHVYSYRHIRVYGLINFKYHNEIHMILINPRNENSEERERERERETADIQTVSSASKILSASYENISDILTNLLVIFLCVSGLRKCFFIRYLK